MLLLNEKALFSTAGLDKILKTKRTKNLTNRCTGNGKKRRSGELNVMYVRMMTSLNSEKEMACKSTYDQATSKN
jgi:hypothetical protein